MLSKSATILNRIASVTTGTSTSRLAIATATVFLASTSVSLAAYSFLTVSGNNVGGNGAFSQFSGTNGTIPVSHSFSAGGAGPQDNINSAIFPSNFSAIPGFAGTGNVQGHVGQTLYGNTSVVTFTMNYTISSTSTVFGMWNTTDEVAQPAYRIELIDASNNAVPPTSFVHVRHWGQRWRRPAARETSDGFEPRDRRHIGGRSDQRRSWHPYERPFLDRHSEHNEDDQSLRKSGAARG